MANKFALDTNVLIYLHDGSSPLKRDIAKNLLASTPFISSQVISEYLNTTRRILDLSKENLLIQAAGLFADCQIVSVSIDTMSLAAVLISKYKFQLFDAIIVASALEAGCKILYSEDMQHKLVVNKTLTIINPFV